MKDEVYKGYPFVVMRVFNRKDKAPFFEQEVAYRANTLQEVKKECGKLNTNRDEYYITASSPFEMEEFDDALHRPPSEFKERLREILKMGDPIGYLNKVLNKP